MERTVGAVQNFRKLFDGKIYIMCPAYYATGGTELLHQTVHKLVHLFGVDAYIYYPDVNWKFEVPPTPARFKKYIGNLFVEQIEDNPANVLIIPETNVRSMFQFPRIRKVLWWLSIDNFFAKLGIRPEDQSTGRKLINFIKQATGRYPFNIIKDTFASKHIMMHLVQSTYAYRFLRSKGVTKVQYLSDYINMDVLHQCEAAGERADQVLYNPAKGQYFIDKLKAASPDIQWLPLQKLTPAEMAKTTALSKVYVDFGNHPGKDRMPREAAMNGCIVITGKKGSAACIEDVPIPDTFKFEQKDRNIAQITNRVRECLSGYYIIKEEFLPYIEKIKQEEAIFNEELRGFLQHIAK